jgi:hypothetical protein
MKTLLYLAAMAGLFTLPSCQTNSIAVPAGALQYPSAEGDFWVYKVTNYQKNTIDTVTVSVVGSIRDPLGPGSFTILQLKWPDKIDSQYVSIASDTLTFYKRLSGYSPQVEYAMTNLIVYPLATGKNYVLPRQNSAYTSDTVRMISSRSVDVNLNQGLRSFTAFREEKVFTLDRMTPMGQFIIFTDEFVPGIGIIKGTITRRIGASPAAVAAWQLLNANVSNRPSAL